MEEYILGGIRDWNKPPSLENLDFDTYLYLVREKDKGIPHEFGNVDPRDNTVFITLYRPDPKKEIKSGSQEEWEQKREWYLKHASSDYYLTLRGMCEGYLVGDCEEWFCVPADFAAEDIYGLDIWKIEKMMDDIKKNSRKRALDLEMEQVRYRGEVPENWEEYERRKREVIYLEHVEDTEDYDYTINIIVDEELYI